MDHNQGTGGPGSKVKQYEYTICNYTPRVSFKLCPRSKKDHIIKKIKFRNNIWRKTLRVPLWYDL